MDQQPEKQPMVYPDKITEELAYVLGRPNFWCGPIAKAMRTAGEYVPEKAEHEQAVVLHMLIKMVLTHGKDWHEHFLKKITELRAAVARQNIINPLAN